MDANFITQNDEDAPAKKGVVAKVNKGDIPVELDGNPNNPFDPLQDASADDAQPWTSQGSEGDDTNRMPKMLNLEKSGLQ